MQWMHIEIILKDIDCVDILKELFTIIESYFLFSFDIHWKQSYLL